MQRSLSATAPATFGPWGHDRHTHADDQFVLACTGTARMAAGGTEHAITTHHGLWIPAGVEHAARFDPGFVPFVHRTGRPTGLLRRPRAVHLDDRTRAALLATMVDGTCPGAVLEHVVRTLPGPEDTDPGPTSPRNPAAVVADTRMHGPLTGVISTALHANPSDTRSLDDWALHLHTSTATIRRAFQREAGVSFTAWRTAVRLRASSAMLRRGRPVATVARAVGLTHNGLLAAYQRHYGCTPSELRRIVDAR